MWQRWAGQEHGTICTGKWGNGIGLLILWCFTSTESIRLIRDGGGDWIQMNSSSKHSDLQTLKEIISHHQNNNVKEVETPPVWSNLCTGPLCQRSAGKSTGHLCQGHRLAEKSSSHLCQRSTGKSTGHLCQGHRSAEKSCSCLWGQQVIYVCARGSTLCQYSVCGMCKQEYSRGHCCLHAVNASTKSSSSCSSKIWNGMRPRAPMQNEQTRELFITWKTSHKHYGNSVLACR